MSIFINFIKIYYNSHMQQWMNNGCIPNTRWRWRSQKHAGMGHYSHNLSQLIKVTIVLLKWKCLVFQNSNISPTIEILNRLHLVLWDLSHVAIQQQSFFIALGMQGLPKHHLLYCLLFMCEMVQNVHFPECSVWQKISNVWKVFLVVCWELSKMIKILVPSPWGL